MKTKTTELWVPEEYEYLGEWKEKFQQLPSNCVLNKGMTGCGATSLAIEQNGCTILAVPFIGLIENKKMKYGDSLLGIYGEGDKVEETAEYLSRFPEYKIAVTYDSVPKIVRVLKRLGRNPYLEAFLAVDEWHIMCQQYSFRYDAIRGLLDEADRFNRKTFISATPLEWKYWLDEIKPFPELILKWPKCELPQVNSFFVDKPLVYMVSRCKERLLNGGATNFHVFLNSVADIGMIVIGAELTPDNTRIICSTSEGNNNQDKLPPGFSIGKAGDPPKLFNFYTSTCFEGCDIYDEDGETFIVSDALKPHTMMDISTSFIQIAGRIRNSKYKNQITQIYSSSRYRKGITAEQYEKDTMEKLKEVEGWIKWMNECPDELKPSFLKQIPYMNEPYVKIVGDQVILDKNMAYQDIVNFKIVHWDYLTPVNMKKRLEEANLQVASSNTIQVLGDIDIPIKIRSSFKDLFELYCEIKSEITYSFSLTEDERIHYIRMYKPLVIEAYQKLGAEKVREMKYHIGDIKRAIASQTSAKEDYKIIEMLSQVFPLHVPIPVKDIKRELQKIYKALGKKSAATARKVGEKWFDVIETQETIKGTNTRCITLLRKKLIRVFNDQ